MWWQCHPSAPLPWLACPGTTVTVTSVHRRHIDSAAWIIFLRCLCVSVVASQLPRGAARLGLAPVPVGMVCPDGMSVLLHCFGPSVRRVIKISKKFACEAASTCCGSLWCAAVIKQLLPVCQHWQSVSVRAQLLCTAGTVATAGHTLSALGFLLAWYRFSGENLNCCFWLLKSLGDSAVLSRINFWTGGLKHTLIQPLVHSFSFHWWPDLLSFCGMFGAFCPSHEPGCGFNSWVTGAYLSFKTAFILTTVISGSTTLR